MQKLFTLTGNLLAETTCLFDFPAQGKTVRAKSATFQVGGKGVNVAKAFNLLSGKACAIVFPAGQIGRLCIDWLKNQNFCSIISSPIDGQTRQGLVCQDASSGIQTTFLGVDVPVGKDALSRALDKVGKRARPGDYFAFCGSFAAFKESYARTIADFSNKHGLKLCIDTYALPLKAFVDTGAFLVKINRDEFDALKKSKRLLVPGASAVENIVITNSSEPIFARFGRNCYKVVPPKVKQRSPTGCGDAFFASLIFELSRRAEAAGALKISAARASASAAIYSTSVWDEQKAQKLYTKTKIEEIADISF